MSKIVMIPIDKVVPDKEQPRKLFDVKELKSLMESILKEGVKMPLLVESNYGEDGKSFLLLDGERRYRASKAGKLTEVPCIVETGPLTFERRTQLRFNIQEQHASWTEIDKARAIYDYKKATGQTIQEIADKLNMHLPKVHTYLAACTLSVSAQQLAAERKIQFSYLTYLPRIIKSLHEIFPDRDISDIETKIIEKIANGIFKTIPDIQNFSKSIQTDSDKEIKEQFLDTPEMSYYEYIGLLHIDAKAFTVKLNKILENLNYELKNAKDKEFRIFDEQFAIFAEIVNKMSEFETVQAVEQNTDPSWGDF